MQTDNNYFSISYSIIFILIFRNLYFDIYIRDLIFLDYVKLKYFKIKFIYL